MNEIETFPVAGWELRTVPALDCVMLNFQYLVSAMETPEQAHTSRNYVLTRAQLRDLEQAIQRTLQRMDTGAIPTDGIPKH